MVADTFWVVAPDGVVAQGTVAAAPPLGVYVKAQPVIAQFSALAVAFSEALALPTLEADVVVTAGTAVVEGVVKL
jgi:hypothetical protein